ncbi:MAG: nitroreductase family protein [Bacteroidales bacterium]|nr:nitroreductase family protein [Bacteroidales bacterium]
MTKKKIEIAQMLNILLAVSLLLLILKFGKNPTNKMEQDTTNTLEIIHQRKSVRNFTPQEVKKEQLQTLIKAAMAAPTAVNKQPWAFIAIKDRDILDRLGEKLPYAKMLKKVNAAIVVCGDLNKTLEDWEQEFWIQDCSAASQNILLAAEAIGLGAVWTAAYPAKDRMQTVSEILGLPESIIPLNVIPVGYPKGVEKPKDKWKPENLHWEQW